MKDVDVVDGSRVPLPAPLSDTSFDTSDTCTTTDTTAAPTATTTTTPPPRAILSDVPDLPGLETPGGNCLSITDEPIDVKNISPPVRDSSDRLVLSKSVELNLSANDEMKSEIGESRNGNKDNMRSSELEFGLTATTASGNPGESYQQVVNSENDSVILVNSLDDLASLLNLCSLKD